MKKYAIMRSAIRSQMSGNSRNPFEKPQEVQKPKEVDTAARAAKSAKVAKELYVSGKSWDGIAKQSSFGQESEIILQQGTTFRVTKVEKTPGMIYIDLEVIGQNPQR